MKKTKVRKTETRQMFPAEFEAKHAPTAEGYTAWKMDFNAVRRWMVDGVLHDVLIEMEYEVARRLGRAK